MPRIINICSGKGGVGKTTIAVNLGVSLQKMGFHSAIIDCNLTTPHLSLYMNNYRQAKTLNDFLKNEAKISEIVNMHKSGLRFVPASLSINDIIGIENVNIKEEIKENFSNLDFVFIDSAPGFGRESLLAMNSSDESILVANPFIPSVVDIAKYSQIAEKNRILGIIINRFRNKKYELSKNDVAIFTELPILGTVPEDENILKSVNSRIITSEQNEDFKSSRAFMEIAARLAGVHYTPRNRWLFWRKKNQNSIAYSHAMTINRMRGYGSP